MADDELMGEILATDIDPGDILTAEVIQWLRAVLDGQTVGDLEVTKVRGLRRILARDTDGIPAGVNCLDVAEALFATLRRLEIIGSPTQAPAAQSGPIQVDVNLPQSLTDMTLRELLTLLVESPDRFSEIWPIISAMQLVRQATAKSPNWAVTTEPGGSLDVDATIAYLNHLGNNRYSTPQRVLQGGARPVTLQRVFNKQERPLMHPFNLSPVTGPDPLGFDWGTLDDELHKALLWALSTQHELWPHPLDLFQASTEVFETPLPARWQRILEDYRQMCLDDPERAVTSRYHTEETLALLAQVGGAAPFAGAASEAAHDDDWYRLRLVDNAGDPVILNASTLSVGTDQVVVSVNARSSTIKFDGAIVLGEILADSSTLRGTIYAPKGGPVPRYKSCSTSRLTLRRKSWKELFDMAVADGMISGS